jgi:predicted nucleic acid-binding protein
MPKKNFFDANIIIDLMYADNKLNKQTIFLFNSLRKNKELLYCSPTTFAITYYFLSKAIKSPEALNKKAKSFFSEFYFTREDNIIMDRVKKSSFTDLEEAEDSGVDLIITKDFFDFKKSSIPVYHPLQYINQFLV